ncbi:MAG: thymidine phosphorylase [Pseudomonadales bacterium RIFCSPHIGHO2_02_FULL_60_43]|nr:MAG: thymidine phosphorylase [Pseudomonadales bacterium RIFCSPHIGHO2_02_FULL_60_43]
MSNQGTPPNPPGSTHTLASRGIQPRFGDLVQSCRKLVMNRLAEHLTGVFAQVDDTLFECAEKAENNQVQTLFFDNMREIRRQRPQIERSYHQQIAQNFSDFLEGKLKPPPSTSKLDAEHMALVQNEDYEESLQVTNMVSRVKARCAQSLFALEQRLALLNNGQKLGEDINPFGPQMIAQAFRDALTPCPFPLRIKVILYTLFDTHVMQSLDSIYTALNQRLIDAGVLPNLKYTAQRNNPLLRPKTSTAAPTEQAPEGSSSASNSQTGTPSAPAPGQSYKPVTTDLSGPPPSDPLELLGSLATLLGEHRQRDIDAPLLGGTRSIASFTPREATSTYSASALLDALNRMQQQSANDLSQRLSRPQQVEGLKADLQQQLEAHSELPGQQKVSDQEADVIDLVGMLFDFILDDDNLPDTCKTTLSHLHTPYLKVALQDKALFTQHHHPARRLLNAMAQAGVLYGGEGDERGLLAKMQWVVERVIHDFFGDLQLFNKLLEEFNEFVATLRHKVELRERRAVEAAKGRDKLLGARQHAVEVIGNSLNNRQPPTIIRNFLELTWADVLVFVLLRNGEQSPEWQRACEAAEQLAWSGTLLDDAGRERLQKLRVPLLEDLRKGLELLGGYHEDGIRRLLQDLVACQHAVQAKQPQVAAQLKPILPESPLGAMLGEDAALATLAPRESTLSTRALALAKELGHIEFGTWFEFVNGEQVRTLKLSWFSPTTRNYMFVDQSGQRVAIKPLTQLATEMEQGLARIVTPERGAPLVDRALTAIYRVLQRFTGRTAEPQE